MKGITLRNGQPLDLDNINPVIGYQAEHRVTGRLLPMCNRFEAYELFTLLKKMGDVSAHLDECGIPFDIWDYDLVEIREVDEGSKFVVINSHIL